MKEKGFTLIELLAVIVILAVIALIATPLIMGTITKAKKNAFIDTAYGIIKAGENYQMSRNMETDGEVSNLWIDDLKDDTLLEYKGTRVKSGRLFTNDLGETSLIAWSGQFCAEKQIMDKTVTVDDKIHTEKDCFKKAMELRIFESVSHAQSFEMPENGTYQIELWGASGGRGHQNGHYVYRAGRGAYTSGVIALKEKEKIYFYVGEKGKDATDGKGAPATFNGGGAGGADNEPASMADDSGAGGGATDVRLVPGAWNEFDSLKTRIMVAAGGSGGSYAFTGTSGGTITGKNATRTEDTHGLGATQTQYLFGYSENGYFVPVLGEGLAGGAGGYYGVKTGTFTNFGDRWGGVPGGATSFISGYSGCNAIASNATETNILHTGAPNHYSGKVFQNGIMIDGDTSMPSPTDKKTMVGNEHAGYAKITLVSVN